jgi:hypothetical protein
MPPHISIIMIDGSFRERFHAVKYLSQQTLLPSAYEIIWVEYYNQLHPELATLMAQSTNTQTICLNRTGEYHSSYCFNAGIMAAQGELILIPDADVVVKPDFLGKLWALHQTNEHLVTYCYRFNEPHGKHQPEISINHLAQVAVLTHPSNWGGCVGARKKWFLEVNGYEQHPLFATGDHGNDFDIYTRFKNLGLHVCWPRDPVLYHPWHPGTLVYAYTHKLQAILTRYQAHQLSTLPYRGINPAFNRELPLGLWNEIETARAQFEREAAAIETPPAFISQHA